VEYYSATKKEKIMLFSEKWMELEIMLSEASQIQKDIYCMFSFLCRVYILKNSKDWDMAQVVKHLPSKCKALSSNSGTEKRRRRRRGRRRRRRK
jgi:hypothetical protein